jgi:tetratricopeptide (TPR) repeat protein
MVELEPNEHKTYWALAMVYEQLGQYEEAVQALQKAMTLLGVSPEKVAALDRAYEESGPTGYWTWRLESKYDRHPSAIAAIYGRLGDKDQAFVWLEKAYEDHGALMHQLKVHPRWDPLRDDPRFQDLLRRMKLTDS